MASPFLRQRKDDRAVADIKRVDVCGYGLMGSGIAQVAATAGCDVIVLEAVQTALDRGLAGIKKSLDKFVEKGTLTGADREATLRRIATTTDVRQLAPCDIVIEAVVENMDLKRTPFGELAGCSPPRGRTCRTAAVFGSSSWAAARRGRGKL